MANQENMGSEFLPEIRRVRIDRLTIFEVSEAELDILQRGSPESLFLNFAVLLLSTAISFSIALATTNIQSTKTFAVFVTLTAIGYVGGLLLLLLWLWNRQSISQVIRGIRGRQPPSGVAAGLSSSPAEDEQAT
jgi:hypothetical protein